MSIEPAPGGDKTVYIEKVGIWWDAKQSQIHIAIPGHPTFHTTVNDKAESKRGHPNLFRKLKDLLAEAGRWPDGS